jgi:formate dehydrogenase major subunit
MKKAMEKLDLLVVIDPIRRPRRRCPMRKNGVYLLPAAPSSRPAVRTASNRSLQWREKVIEPLFESKPDHTIMYAFAKKLGFERSCQEHQGVKDSRAWDEPRPKTSCARSTPATGPSATPASRPSA